MAKKKNSVLLIGLILILVLVIGFSYGYYLLNRVQENNNVVGSKCFNLEFTNEKNAINLDNMYPISDEEGRKLTPYSFTITNTCDMLAGYTVNMEMLEGTTLNSKYLDVMVNNEQIKLLTNYESTSTVITGSTESRILAKGTLAYNDSVDYTVRFWMDKDVEDTESMNKLFKSKIVISATPSSWNPKDAGYDTLHDAILANEYQTTPTDAITKIGAKGEPDLSQTAPVIHRIEKKGEQTINKIVKPAANAINSDELTSALSINDTMLRISKNKSLDETGGKFSLTNQIIVDPTALDYSSNDYYYSVEYVSKKTDNKLHTDYNYSGYTIYKIVSATKEDSVTKWENKEYPSVTYSLNVIPISTKELETDKSDKGLYEAIDDFGKTYYYRGNIQNNYVQFGNFKWRILRINGDGTIRLLYSGKINDNTNYNVLKNWYYNINFNNPGYFGYMHGKNIGDRVNNIKNEIDSDIKKTIDEWYETNLKLSYLEKYLGNIDFCSDRSIYEGDGESTTNYTFFGGIVRIENNVPTFKCPNIDNDLNTLSNSSYGNKSLKYSIGLPTADELVFSGYSNSKLNKLTWTYSTNGYWTATPSHYNSSIGAGYEYQLTSLGYIEGPRLSSAGGVRPVINLKSDVKITGGIGTSNDPYVIDTSK